MVNSYDLDMPGKTEIEIECRVDRRSLDNNAIIPISVEKHVAFGTFSFDVQVFQDSIYSAPYRSEDYPISVKYGEAIYVAASVGAPRDLEISIDTCWVTRTDDPLGEYETFIKDG